MEEQDYIERLSKAKQDFPDLFKNENDYTDEDIIRYHEEIYNACGLEKPKVIILDSPFLCKKACLVFSKIDKFIKDETKKYCKKNDKKYLLDHLFENWHSLLDDEHFDDYDPNKDYVVKVLDSHVKKHIENTINSNHSLFEKVSNFFASNFKKGKLSLENNKFGVINSFFLEKINEKSLPKSLESYFYDKFLHYANYVFRRERWGSCEDFIKKSIKNGLFFEQYITSRVKFTAFSHVLGMNNSDDYGVIFFNDLARAISRPRFMALLEILSETDMCELICSGYIAFYNIFNACLCSIQQDQYVFVSRNAEKKNVLYENGRLHSVNDYAYKFLDGTGYYFFKGQRVEQDLFQLLSEQKYTFEHFTNEKNEEIKSLALAFYEEKFGSDFVREFVSQNLVEVDTFVHKKSEEYLEGTKGMNVGVYTLLKGTDKDIQFAYVRCFCPSTDRMFFLGVNPIHNDAKNAIASLCEVPRELRKHLVSIRRQGEIFSFSFDDEGTQKLKENKINLKVTVPLHGDEYFDKMEYEY